MKLQLEKNWELKVMVKGMRQSFYVMYSQKIMQCQRIKYMMLNGYLNNADLHLKAWEYIADKMHIILQLLLKENIKNKFDVAMKYKIISELDALREYEMERIHSFLRDIVLTG